MDELTIHYTNVDPQNGTAIKVISVPSHNFRARVKIPAFEVPGIDERPFELLPQYIGVPFYGMFWETHISHNTYMRLKAADKKYFIKSRYY
jgi:hypothetical protein